MLKALVAVVVLLAGLVLFRVVFKKKKEPEHKPAKYICDHCGEYHCECHLESEE